MKFRTIILLFFSCLLLHLHAQTPALTTIPYLMGFEESDSLELKNWVLNNGDNPADGLDKWYVGSATKFDGKQALYISRDGGHSALFGNKVCVQYAYRDFVLPTGTYEFSFDWRCIGSSDQQKQAQFYVGFGQKSRVVCIGSSKSGTLDADAIPLIKADDVSGLKMLRDSTEWSNFSFRGSVNQAYVYRLFFVWTSLNTDTTLQMPVGACIDNVQITSSRCRKPTSISIDARNDSLLLSWKGSSDQYALQYRLKGNEVWREIIGITQDHVVLENLDEGMYDFRVRGICGPDTSAYKYLTSYILFWPDRHCIDYVHLKGNPNVTPTIGTFANPYMVSRLVDQGYDDKFKRHTVNWEQDVFDPRTGNQLRLIPEGEMASVRLGNWNINAEAESLTYLYTVDSASSTILLLKYAIILEAPGHGSAADPRFIMEVLDEDGNLIDRTCGAVDFWSDINTIRQEMATDPNCPWHVSNNVPDATSEVVWRDWSIVGVNLQAYAGQTIRVRLTTKDCNAQGHFGYAYFVLGCASAKMEGLSCGEDTVMTVNAPIGFDYTWTDKYGNVVSHDRQWSVESTDTTTYTCTLSYKDNPDCKFQLTSAARPRYPVAEMDYEIRPSNCQNKVYFKNKCHVMTRFAGEVEHHYDEPCHEFQWDFGNGQSTTEINPGMIIYPNEGGTFPVRLWTSINGHCEDEQVYNVVVPPIGDTILNVDTTICEGKYIVFGDKYSTPGTTYCSKDSIYTATWKNVAGCDSTVVLNLKLHPSSEQQLNDTILCADQILAIGGQQYNPKNGDKFYVTLQNAYGCDSVLWMNVTILDSIKPTVQVNDIQGDKEYSGSLQIGGTGYTYYEMGGVRYDTTQTLISGLNGGEFTLVFFNDLGCYVEQTVHMGYPCRNLIFQRWNDVLSVYNSQTQQTRYPDMPVMDYTSFQWMKDSVDVPGAVLSYYYEEGGLNMNSFYQVRVITTDGEILISCPFYPEAYSPKKEPKIRKVIENKEMIIIVDDVRYNAQGRRIL